MSKVAEWTLGAVVDADAHIDPPHDRTTLIARKLYGVESRVAA